jgi:tetratricopeptide (TPR) repeat protein
MADQVCKLVGRNLTYEEWQRFVGEAIPYERTCPNLPIHPSLLEAGDRLASALDYEGAVAIFRRALELDPQLGLIPELRAHEAVALARLVAGDLPGALADLEQARAAVPADDADNIAKAEGWLAALRAGQNPFLEEDTRPGQSGAESDAGKS